jgi:uncharacterized membrane protein
MITLMLVLMVVLWLASWLAPALIVLRGARPVDAMRMSLAASWHSMGALTVYGTAFFFLVVAASIPLLIGWLFLLPIMSLSTYAAYRELFEDSVEVLDSEPLPPAGGT